MKNCIILFIALVFVACQQKQEKIIEYIEVLYYNGIFESIKIIGCDEIIYTPTKIISPSFLEDGTLVPQQAYIIDTIITNKQVLQEIAKELQLAKKTEDYGIDARMKCYIKYTNGEIDSICTDESYIYGYYNEKLTKFTNKFVYLIRKNSGFYNWIGISMMPYFNELNDTTFVRKTITNRWGHSY